MEDCIGLVSNGAKFSVNLQARSLRINGKYLVKDGECIAPGCFRKEDYPADKVMREIEHRYASYKHSVPSERSETRRHTYFMALPEKELSDEDMLYGEPRELARFDLEFFVLMMIVCGALTWQAEWGSWFWQSPHDKDLVILRSWVEPSH